METVRINGGSSLNLRFLPVSASQLTACPLTDSDRIVYHFYQLPDIY